MKSPLTGGETTLIEKIEEHEFRKEKFMIHVRYYVCNDTNETFTTNEQDELFCNELYSQYRIKHSIPFPDEIKAIREHYKLNYNQISKITGFGLNQWKQYEQGVVPSESNGKIILAIKEKNTLLAFQQASKNHFEKEEFEKIAQKIASSTNLNEKDELQQLLYSDTKRGIMNGFATMNPQKLKAMVHFLIAKEGNGICPTKLNKEMFYADFLHFKKYGVSISGLQYKAITFGPVPYHYDTIYDNINNIIKEIVIQYDTESIKLKNDTSYRPEYEIFSRQELETLNIVSNKLTPMKTSEIVNLSHQEEAWIKHQNNHGLIPYTEAFSLKAL